MKRIENRANNEMRPIFLGPGFIKNAKGSCFVKFGDTHVICAASIEEKVPPFLRNTGTGWITAEYGMLPCSTKDRIEREAAKGKQSGRTQEIQRLIGRSLRTVVDLKMLGERQIKIDCDVIQADGGTRTASITGGFIALYYAVKNLLKSGKIKENPIIGQVAAISCGIVQNENLLDLNYQEDSNADVDANFVINDKLEMIEVQITGEKNSFSTEKLIELTKLSQEGIEKILKIQKEVMN